MPKHYLLHNKRELVALHNEEKKNCKRATSDFAAQNYK